MSADTRDFALGDVLTVATGRFVSRRGVEGLYDILNFMTRDNLFTHQLPRALRECRPWILRQHPQLAAVSVEESNGDTWERWLSEHEARFGATLPVGRIPRDDHTERDPIEELCDIVGPEKVIVLDTDGIA